MSEATIIAAVRTLVDDAVNPLPAIVLPSTFVNQFVVGFTEPPWPAGYAAVSIPSGTYYASGDGTATDLCKAIETALLVRFGGVPVTWTCSLVGSKLKIEASASITNVSLIWDPDPAGAWVATAGLVTMTAADFGFGEDSYPMVAGGALDWTLTSPADLSGVTHTVLVHDDLRWVSQPAAFAALFKDAATDHVHTWLVTRSGYDEKLVGCNNLSIGTHKIKVFGVYGLRDTSTTTGVLSETEWRPIKAAVLQALRTHYTLHQTVMGCGPPQVVDEGHRAFQWAFCHWIEIDVPVRERVSYLEV